MRPHPLRGRHRLDQPSAPGGSQQGRPQGRPRVGRTAMVLVTAAAAAAVVLTPLATAASKLPVPQPAVKLPVTAEALAPYTPQVSCDPVAKPGVVAFRTLMLTTYKRGTDGGIVRACDQGGPSEHKEGRAWDWMLDLHNPQDAAVASAVLQFLLAPGPHGEPGWNARRFGIMYVIWDAQIWGAYRPTDGWRPYTGASEHTDHIHFSFSWAGAMKRTSWWTGKVAAVDYGPCQSTPGALAPVYRAANPNPCPLTTAPAPSSVSAPVIVTYAKPGDSGTRVRIVQIKLGVRPVSGFFGDRTTAAVKKYQTRLGLRATGVVDGWTAFRLGVGPSPMATSPVPAAAVYAKPGDSGPRVRVLQIKLGVRPVSGFFGDKTAAALKAYQARIGLRPTGVVDAWTAYRLGVGPNPTPVAAQSARPYARLGDRGAHVTVVQVKLGVRPATGLFGTRTLAAVKAYQAHLGLRVTGVVEGWTAYRLGVGPNPSPPPAKPLVPVVPAVPYAKPGESGAKVVALQITLGVHPATGFYGTKTTAAVRAYQAREHLPVTGVVDRATAVRLRLVRS